MITVHDRQFELYLTEAEIPFSRLHDVGGMYGGSRFVDIPNLFPDFGADETDPASYRFAYTDALIQALLDIFSFLLMASLIFCIIPSLPS